MASQGEFLVYVSTAGDGTILVLRMGSAQAAPGRVQTIQIAKTAGVGMSTPMAVSPDRRFLHAALRTPPLPIASFRIGGDGRLEPVGTARAPASTPYVATDRTGRLLFTAANPGSTLAVSAIDADGHVAPRAHQLLHIGHKLHCVVVSGDNRFVYASSTDDGVIHVLRLDPGRGLLEPADPPLIELEAGGDPRHMAFSPDGLFLYVTTEAGGRVAVFAVDAATGRLSERPGAAMMPDGFTGEAMTADIHLTPDGRFCYATERAGNRIVAYRIDQHSGALSLIEACETERRPRAFAISPDGSFLLVAGQESGRLAAYAIDETDGTLTPGIEIETGPEPNWIEFVDPAAR